MFDRSERGAARVSAVWLIVLIVLLFAAMFFGYVAADGQARAEDQAAAQLVIADKAVADLEAVRGDTRLVSEILGFYDTADLAATTDLNRANENLATLKQTIGPEADDTIKTFEAAWPLAIKQVSARDETIRTMKAQVEDLKTQVTAAQSAGRDAAQAKDGEISTLTQQLGDAQSNASDEKNELESTVARLRSEIQQKDADALALRNTIAANANVAQLDASEAQSRMSRLTDQMKLIREPQAFDGEVLSISEELELVYIDKGVKDRIVRGMRFQVIDGDPRLDLVRGEIEVTKVGDGMSEARLVSQSDPFRPLVAGDIITNPLYDAEGERNCILAGRFSGTFNKRELEILLAEIGIGVQSQLDRSTTFLIVGEPLYTDPETGEAAEEPIPVSDLAVYKEAQALGAQIVHISEIRHFFRR
ncbi:MAG: hypothetical protein ACI8QC_002537 [Planctomycetota bacterium]|jgi:hypothetical protein